MISILVAKPYVWPIRFIFISLAFVVANMILDKLAQGYVISAGGTKYLAGTTTFYTGLLKYLALDFVLVLFAVRTIPKEHKPEKTN
ncbi:hypothetical protein [Rheinheimera soli]|uniref:Uncharacterized protein n=1 Tax=Rheinheimera soli TaxID=443616 RepID=A0ABU1W006_9GAMM|nr:hypothetical protein [Rheinheimera soli]MDR7121185.1 hypothetical protein [Rheinheimera soli]